MSGSSKEEASSLKTFVRKAVRKVREIPPDHLYGMSDKLASIRDWRDRARSLIKDLYTEALFKFVGVCFVVLINKRLDCKIPIIFTMLQMGEPVKIGPFTVEYKSAEAVRVECIHDKGSWVCTLNIDTSYTERDKYLMRAFSTSDRALKWLNENVDKLEL